MWLLQGASVMAAATGTVLTWESNPISGERSGISVMSDHNDAALPALIFLGALLVTLAGIVGAAVDRHRRYAWAATGGALTTLGAAVWYGVQIAGTRVRAIGMDSAGNLVEPEAASHPGAGWFLTATALLATAVLAIVGRHPDVTSARGDVHDERHRTGRRAVAEPDD